MHFLYIHLFPLSYVFYIVFFLNLPVLAAAPDKPSPPYFPTLLLPSFLLSIHYLFINNACKYFLVTFLYRIQLLLFHTYVTSILFNFYFFKYLMICFVIFESSTTAFFSHIFYFYFCLNLPVLAAAPDMSLSSSYHFFR